MLGSQEREGSSAPDIEIVPVVVFVHVQKTVALQSALVWSSLPKVPCLYSPLLPATHSTKQW